MKDFTFTWDYTGANTKDTYDNLKTWVDLINTKEKEEEKFVYLVIPKDGKDYYGFYDEDPKIKDTDCFKVTMANYYKSIHDGMIFGDSFFEVDGGEAVSVSPIDIKIVYEKEK